VPGALDHLVDAAQQVGVAPFRRTPDLSRCAAIPVSVLVVRRGSVASAWWSCAIDWAAIA